VDFEIQPPRAPDIRIGKIFDRNWELISFILPMTSDQTNSAKKFPRKDPRFRIQESVPAGISVGEIVNGALNEMEKEALSRIDDLVATIPRLDNCQLYPKT
jgi:hypothetical protein